jgi:putative membrane protein
MRKPIIVLTLLISTCAVQAQNSLSEKDKKFIKQVAQGSLMEVRLGKLAQTNGSSSEVKDLGQHMITDHSKAEKELKSLAQRKNVAVLDNLSKKEQKAYDRLSKKQGTDFDKAYTKCMVKDHKKDICEFKKEAKHGTDPDLKDWASSKVTVLEHHKQMSIDACNAVRKK